jgi:hypothetical protein
MRHHESIRLAGRLAGLARGSRPMGEVPDAAPAVQPRGAAGARVREQGTVLDQTGNLILGFCVLSEMELE